MSSDFFFFVLHSVGVVVCFCVCRAHVAFTFHFGAFAFSALASHAARSCGRFSHVHVPFILAVGAEALSMTPSGDALFAS